MGAQTAEAVTPLGSPLFSSRYRSPLINVNEMARMVKPANHPCPLRPRKGTMRRPRAFYPHLRAVLHQHSYMLYFPMQAVLRCQWPFIKPKASGRPGFFESAILHFRATF